MILAGDRVQVRKTGQQGVVTAESEKRNPRTLRLESRLMVLLDDGSREIFNPGKLEKIRTG